MRSETPCLVDVKIFVLSAFRTQYSPVEVEVKSAYINKQSFVLWDMLWLYLVFYLNSLDYSELDNKKLEDTSKVSTTLK